MVNKDQTEKEYDSVPSPSGTQRKERSFYGGMQYRAGMCYNNLSESDLEKVFGESSDVKNAQCRSSSHGMNPNDGTVNKPKNVLNISSISPEIKIYVD